MMYSEFVKGTGCKENEYNFKIFQDLEALYMDSDMTKEDVYKLGKKLVDNSKTQKELEFEAQMKENIEGYENSIEVFNRKINLYKSYIAEGSEDKEMLRYYRERIRDLRNEIKDRKYKIATCKGFLIGRN